MITLARSFAQMPDMSNMPQMPSGGENPMEGAMGTGMSTGMEWAGKAKDAADQFNPSG